MSDLTDRMRTCAAAIASRGRDALLPENMLNDAADLLLEASNALEAIPEPLGELMELLEPEPPALAATPEQVSQWYSAGDTLPLPREGKPSPRPNRVCPQCDSRAAKRVFRDGPKLFLACPACAAVWEYKP